MTIVSKKTRLISTLSIYLATDEFTIDKTDLYEQRPLSHKITYSKNQETI